MTNELVRETTDADFDPWESWISGIDHNGNVTVSPMLIQRPGETLEQFTARVRRVEEAADAE